MIICDSREKKWEHIEKYFIKENIDYIVQKLDFGDYMDTDNTKIVIDRKRNLNEVAQNLCSYDSSRFWREVRGSYKNEIHLIFLIEHGGPYKDVMDVINWKSKYCRLTGRRLVEEMLRVSYSYGVDWIFCNKRITGREIVRLLSGE